MNSVLRLSFLLFEVKNIQWIKKIDTLSTKKVRYVNRANFGKKKKFTTSFAPLLGLPTFSLFACLRI